MRVWGLFCETDVAVAQLDAKEEKVYRRWLDWKLQPYGVRVQETLDTAFLSGEVLAAMLKCFADVDFVVKLPKSHLQRMDQLTAELRLLKQADWPAEVET
jgi:hypothetical protein